MAVADQNAAAPQPPPSRYALLDVLRGVAVLAMASYHFYGLLTHEGRTSLFGPVLDWVCKHGHYGAEVMLVISGFVLTHALRPLRMNPSTIGRFALRRSIRLLPAYWVVLLASFLADGILTHYGVIDRPAATVSSVLANMLLLQEVLGVNSPMSVAALLCAVVQCYVVFVLLLWVFQWLRKLIPLRLARLLVFGPPALASLMVAADHLPSLQGVHVEYWHLFFLGTVLYWSLMGVISTSCFWIYLTIMMVFCNGRILGGVGTGLAIFGFARLDLLNETQHGRFLLFAGSRSYSLYLVHVLVGSNLIRLLLRQQAVPETFLVLVCFFIAAMLASFIAAEILYRLIERPTHRLAREVAWENPSPAVASDEQPATPASQVDLSGGGLLTAYLQRSWPGLLAAIRAEGSWLIPVCLFAAIWLTEMFIVQDLTLAPDHHVGRKFDFFAPKIRFMMDVCFIGALISVVSRRGLFFLAVGSSLVSLILLTYHSYFYRPFSILHIVQNLREGMELSPYAWDLLHGTTVLSLSAVLVLKLLAIRSIPASPRWRYPAWMGFFGVFSLGYILLFAFANLPQIDPLAAMVDRRTLGQVGVIRGYLGPWIAELYYLNDDRLRQRALARREWRSDQLTPVEYPLPIEPRLVIVQVETLDYKVIDHRIRRGEDLIEVTPFLNRLRNESMFYRTRVFRFQGSCDSDFTMMANVAATAQVNAYALADYPYDDAYTRTLPRVLREHGFEPIALHGYPASFYNRGSAFFKMGFKQSLFQEVLEHDYGLPAAKFGILDEHVLQMSTQKLREAKVPTFHFIITLTSHWPYKCAVPRADYPYPRPANEAEDFFNSMRYVDDCLRDYVASLPKHTTLVIYGDHTTNVQDEDFTPDRGPSGEEYVPVFIYDTSSDLAELQRTRDKPLAKDGELNLLDISTFLSNRIAAVDAVTTDGKPLPAADAGPADPAQPNPEPAEPGPEKPVPLGAADGDGPIARREGTGTAGEKLGTP